ncbi:MAG: 3-deoxy-manno-octulosonate cytidylyltransferase [Prevotella sp.]|nr:3-deoxy-manno-octulosonate cytidylyltransferase [Prevotella sp.]
MKTIAIIPARYGSSRFPGKPLAVLGGMTVIERVCRQAEKCVDDVVVATDDERIYDHVRAFGGRVVMTSKEHRSGTDRINEALQKIGGEWDVVVNVQGDEPFIAPSQIEAVMDCFRDESVDIATLGKPFASMEEVENPNSPKIARSELGFALYFSRSVIPFVRGKERQEWIGNFRFLKHIGLYAYRPEVLKRISSLPQSPLERAESLEQLRWLEAGYRIQVALTDIETVGIDTPDDLRRAEELIKKG